MHSANFKSSFLPDKLTLPEVSLPSDLPVDLAALTLLMDAQRAAHQAAVNLLEGQFRDQFNRLIEQFILSRHRQFGVSSEQLSGQGCLFDEAEVLVAESTEAQDIAPIPPEAAASSTEGEPKGKARGKRGPLPAELPRVVILHDVPEADRFCACGTPMILMGQQISEQLDIVPMQIRVLQHVRNTYGCPVSEHAPVTAPAPVQPLPKSNASADFLAMLLTVKYVDGLPLTRFNKVLNRHGAPVPVQTLARWVIGSAEKVLQPLFNVMRDTLFDGRFIHMDETVVQVLKEKDKSPTSNSYMWVGVGGPPGEPVVIYDYDPSRSGAVPARLLQGYQGYLMTDGYEGYNQLVRTEQIAHLVCWAHVRRKFVEATRVQPKGRKGLADQAVALIGRLYGVERKYKEASVEERYLARQSLSLPILAELRAWLDKTQPAVVPKSALGTALSYMNNYWGKLTRYTEAGDLPIDNNRCENAIRPFVVGRKAWLFSDTPAGANASAIIYSMVETAKANGLDPYAWLRRIMRDLPSARTVEEVEALLPWNLHAADLIIEMVR
jgi:transposase